MSENKTVENTGDSVTAETQTVETQTVEQPPTVTEPQTAEPDHGTAGLNPERLMEPVNNKLGDLKTQLEALQTEFKSKLKYDAHKDKIIDNLHAEVQKYKKDLIKKLTQSIIMDIILTIDGITKLTRDLRAVDRDQLNPLKLIQQMEGIGDDLEEVLYRQGVDPFTSTHDEFDSKKQKIVKTKPTDDPLKHKTVAKRLYKGYNWDEKVLRKEPVNIYVPAPAAPTAPKTTTSETPPVDTVEEAKSPETPPVDTVEEAKSPETPPVDTVEEAKTPETLPVDTVEEAKSPETTTPEPNNKEENNHE